MKRRPEFPIIRPPKIRHPDVIVARERAHAVFDLLWGCGYMTQTEAYCWLRKTFNKPSREAHMGRMSIEECARVEREVAALLRRKGVIAELAKWQSLAMRLQGEKPTT